MRYGVSIVNYDGFDRWHEVAGLPFMTGDMTEVMAVYRNVVAHYQSQRSTGTWVVSACEVQPDGLAGEELASTKRGNVVRVAV